MKRREYRVRASSLPEFFSCPALWAEKNLAGRHLPSTPPAAIGTAVHKSTAVYDTHWLEDQAITPDDAAEVLMQHLIDPGEEVDWRGTSQKKSISTALAVHTRYCQDIAPLHEYTAVELTLDDVIVAFNEYGLDIRLTGTLDRLYTLEHKLGVADLKTGARAVGQGSGKHRAQLGVYELLADEYLRQHNMGTIEAPGEIIQLQTSADYKVAVTPVLDARTLLLGDEENTGLLVHIARALDSGDFWGNPSSWLCSEKYCPAWSQCFYR